MSSAPLEPREGPPVDRPVLGGVLLAADALAKAAGQDVWRLQEPELGAVLEGLEAVRRAAAVLRAMEQVRPFVDAFEEAQRRARGLSVRPGPGELTDFTWRLDPEGAAFVHAAIDPLSKPAPDGDGPDLRSPAQRRCDALLEVLHRGMGSPGAAPTTTRAKVVITFSYDQLTDQVSGLGRTLTGQQLTGRTIRRIACQADLIPTVLGADGEVLDLGRRTRLATPAQRLALWLEEKGCTYQGCSMPAQWCDAHHATWWSRGGSTDHDNLHLLCARHPPPRCAGGTPTRVHDRDLTPVKQPDGTLHWQPDNP